MTRAVTLSVGLCLAVSIAADAGRAEGGHPSVALLAELGPVPQVFDPAALDVAARAIGQDRARADAYLEELDASYDRHYRVAFDAATGAALHDRLATAAAVVQGDAAALLPASDGDALAGWIMDRFAQVALGPERLDDVLCLYAGAIWAAGTGQRDLIESSEALDIVCRQIDHAEGQYAPAALAHRNAFPALRDALLVRLTVLLTAADPATGADGEKAAPPAIDVPDAALLKGVVLGDTGFVRR